MLQIVLFLAGVCNRVSELLIRSLIDPSELSEEAKSLARLAISQIIGIGAALFTNVNLLTDPSLSSLPVTVSPLAGVVITGVLIGGGANVVNEALGWLSAKKDAVQSTSVATATVTTKNTSPDGAATASAKATTPTAGN